MTWKVLHSDLLDFSDNFIEVHAAQKESTSIQAREEICGHFRCLKFAWGSLLSPMWQAEIGGGVSSGRHCLPGLS